MTDETKQCEADCQCLAGAAQQIVQTAADSGATAAAREASILDLLQRIEASAYLAGVAAAEAHVAPALQAADSAGAERVVRAWAASGGSSEARERTTAAEMRLAMQAAAKWCQAWQVGGLFPDRLLAFTRLPDEQLVGVLRSFQGAVMPGFDPLSTDATALNAYGTALYSAIAAGKFIAAGEGLPAEQ